MQDLIQLPEVVTDPEFKRRVGGPCDWGMLDPKMGEQSNSGGTHWITHKWYAVIQEFNLKRHYQHMKHKHPDWTDAQIHADNWSSTVYVKLLAKAEKYKRKVSTEPDGFCHDWSTILVEDPKKHGVDIIATMAKVGVDLEKCDSITKQVMLFGVTITTPQETPKITSETPDCIWPYHRHTKSKCVVGKCACCTVTRLFAKTQETCRYKRPSIEKEITFAKEHGFDCITQCRICGKFGYYVDAKIPNRCHPDHPKCCNEMITIIWLASENQPAINESQKSGSDKQ